MSRKSLLTRYFLQMGNERFLYFRQTIWGIMKHFSLAYIFALALAFFFVACGDDESSFAPRDDESSSSIEDVTPQSSEDETSVSSSSAKSSSSVNAKSSESAKSSSSSVTPKSSVSETSVSSSNAKSSSSTKSSSSVPLSSSEYVPFDHSKALAEDWRIGENRYKTFTDPRNGRSYYYITIYSEYKGYSVTVMAENLNIGEMVLGENDQNNDSKIERYCYNNDTTKCDEFGGLYQWAEMMQLPSRCNTESCADLIQPNHQGICPDGWRLLTQDDFYIVLHADNNRHGIQDTRAISFGGFNYSGYSLVGAGYVWDRRLENLGTATHWFYAEEGTSFANERAFASTTTNSGDIFTTYEVLKTNGLSVRCVKLEE